MQQGAIWLRLDIDRRYADIGEDEMKAGRWTKPMFRPATDAELHEAFPCAPCPPGRWAGFISQPFLGDRCGHQLLFSTWGGNDCFRYIPERHRWDLARLDEASRPCGPV